MKEKIKKPKRGSKNKPPKIILEFDPDPTFEEDFLEFIETVLSWNKKTHNKEINGQK